MSIEVQNLTRLILAGGENQEIAKVILFGTGDQPGNLGLLHELVEEFEYNAIEGYFDVRRPETWYRLKCALCEHDSFGGSDIQAWILRKRVCSEKSPTFPDPCTNFKDRYAPF